MTQRASQRVGFRTLGAERVAEDLLWNEGSFCETSGMAMWMHYQELPKHSIFSHYQNLTTQMLATQSIKVIRQLLATQIHPQLN